MGIDRVAERAGLRLFPGSPAPVLPRTRTQETFQIWPLGCVLCLLNILWVFHYFGEIQFHTQHSGLSEHTLPQTQNHRSSPPTPRSPGLPALRHAALRAQHLRARDLQADGAGAVSSGLTAEVTTPGPRGSHPPTLTYRHIHMCHIHKQAGNLSAFLPQTHHRVLTGCQGGPQAGAEHSHGMRQGPSTPKNPWLSRRTGTPATISTE